MRRRTFLQSLPAVAAAAYAEPVPADPVPVKLGFDTYSIRAFNWKVFQFIDYAAAQKLDTIQISSMADYETYEPAYLQKVKDQAARHNIQLDAGMGCICPLSKSFSKNGPPARDRVLEGLRVAKAVGAASMRCYLGASADRLGSPGIEACMESTINVFKSVRTEALDLGVKIALENHSGDTQAREVKIIIEEAGKDYVASCLDTGNPMWCIEDPFVTLETLAPYVVTTHVRDSAVFETPRGAAAQWVALGDHHGTPSDGPAVSGSGFLEGVPQDTRRRVRALRGAGEARASIHGLDGDRGYRGQEAGPGDGRGA
jgi:3-oxoisoapionate decarboxylase